MWMFNFWNRELCSWKFVGALESQSFSSFRSSFKTQIISKSQHSAFAPSTNPKRRNYRQKSFHTLSISWAFSLLSSSEGYLPHCQQTSRSPMTMTVSPIKSERSKILNDSQGNYSKRIMIWWKLESGWEFPSPESMKKAILPLFEPLRHLPQWESST